MDDCVSLCALKRFVADFEVGKREIPVPRAGTRKDRRVAVIGGGPSGMTCALYLRKAGYGVTIFESRDRLGGMLSFAVPAFRLPRHVLEREVSVVEKAGVEVRYRTKVGRDVSLKEIYETFDAVYIGCGSQQGSPLGLVHEDAAEVVSGIDFLSRTNEGRPAHVGKRVVVIGGGNVAVDAAMTARRLGAREVRIVCLEKREEMAAGKEEVDQAVAEGVKVLPAWAPQKILIDEGRAKGIELVRCTSVFDGAGKFSPAYHRKVTRIVRADMVIVAVGQAPDITFAGDLPGLEPTSEGRVKSDPATLRTTLPGVFAGGDVASPRAGTAVGAIGREEGGRPNRCISLWTGSALSPRVCEEKVT